MAPEVATPAQRPLVQESGGARRLAGDAWFAFAMLNEARYRALASIFGASREQANVATFVAAIVLAGVLRERGSRLVHGPMTPALPDELIGTAVLRELLGSAAGPAVRDSPELSNLLLLGILARGGVPVLARALRGLKGASHRMDAGFRGRYGYLVDVGHRRARHYEAQARKALAARQER